MERGSLGGLLNGLPLAAVIVNKEGRVVIWNDPFHVLFAELPCGRENPLTVGGVLACDGESPDHPCPGLSECARCQVAHVFAKTVDTRCAVQDIIEVPIGSAGAWSVRRFRALGVRVPSDNEEMVAVLVRDVDAVLAGLSPKRPFGVDRLVGNSRVVRELKETVLDVAASRAPVLITGESGTGKELVARAVHEHSDRRDELFVPVNCGALPEGLLESELFGHVRGSFTGAVRDKRGRFQLANRGTIFLDEVGELPVSVQVKLLRVLQDGTFNRVGDETATTVDLRVVAATNRDLHRAMRDGSFRSDLFYRLAVIPLSVPPLRERREDIPALARHLLDQAAIETGWQPPPLDDQTVHVLSTSSWPGNVRQLENVLQFALIKSKGRAITPDFLPPTISGPDETGVVRGVAERPTAAEIHRALEETSGNRSRAARRLGVSRATLYRYLSKLGQKSG